MLFLPCFCRVLWCFLRVFYRVLECVYVFLGCGLLGFTVFFVVSIAFYRVVIVFCGWFFAAFKESLLVLFG